MLFGKKRREADAESRRATKPVFESRGWTWQDAAPPPQMELQEAVLRTKRPYGDIWTVGMSEVTSGNAHAYQATAARIVGYEFVRSQSGTPFGRRAETNAVWLRLPASLPELRLDDTTLPRRKDHGIRLPPLPRLAAGLSARWGVEGFVPAYAADVLSPTLCAALENAPERSSIVIRAGFAVCYGMHDLDVGTVDSRTHLLASVLGLIPEHAWGRADPLVAGTGVSPVGAPDGARLLLLARLTARDWQGYGLHKVPWQDAPTASSTVSLRHREAIDVWENKSNEPPGVHGRLSIGSLGAPRFSSTARQRGIPTVAEWMRSQ